MEENEILIVGGLGRCGSTLLMRMLYEGGMPVVADNTVAFEDMRTLDITAKDYWLSDAQGKAIKILTLHTSILPYEFKYRVIWLRRNTEEQAKSQIKLLQQVANEPVRNRDWKKMQKAIIADEAKILAMLERRRINAITFDFEDILMMPMLTAEALKDWVGMDLDVKRMRAAVRERNPACAPDMAMEAEYLRTHTKLL